MSLDLFNGLLNLIAAAHEPSEFFPLFVELDSIGIAAQYEAICMLSVANANKIK